MCLSVWPLRIPCLFCVALRKLEMATASDCVGEHRLGLHLLLMSLRRGFSLLWIQTTSRLNFLMCLKLAAFIS